MQNPTASCTYCGRQRDCMLHMRADHPPTAAKAWLKRTCKHEEKPCEFGYRAGVDVDGLKRALTKSEV